jgi:hypothetical protein
MTTTKQSSNDKRQTTNDKRQTTNNLVEMVVALMNKLSVSDSARVMNEG